MEEKRDRGIRQFIERWFSPRPRQDEAENSEETPEDGSALSEQPPIEVPGAAITTPVTRTISEKIAALKRTIEFDRSSQSDLNKISAPQDLLHFCQKNLLQKFNDLQEIGILSHESSLVLDQMHMKFDSILLEQAEGIQSRAASDSDGAGKLAEQNQLLKIQLKGLRDKFVKRGIVSERELELEEEARFQKRRIRELQTKLGVLERKNAILSQAQEIAHGLRAKNSLLNSRLANQERVIQTLTASDSSREELTSRLEELRAENRYLKEHIGKHSESLDQLRKMEDLDGSAREEIERLAEKSRQLQDKLGDRNDRLEGLMSANPDLGVNDVIEMLSDENFHLKSLLESRQALQDMMDARSNSSSSVGSAQIIDLLKLENQRFQEALVAKKEQTEALRQPPSCRSLMKVFMRANEESRQVKKENDLRMQQLRELEQERELLRGEVRKMEEVVKKNRQLQTKLDESAVVIGNLKKIETKYKELRKSYSALATQHEAVKIETNSINIKLSKVMAEYEVLVKEYENLFGQLKL
ncbi:MAG: hypothetical protein AB7W37_08145 [Syntrophobacteraceae bacterium]